MRRRSSFANRRRLGNRINPLREKAPFSGEFFQRHGILGLHCGSGVNLHPHWLSTDLLKLAGKDGGRSRPGRIVSCGQAFYLQHDAAEPYPLATGSLKRILAEHFIEHLPPHEGISWFRGMRRLLAPGGVLRISTPDLEKYVRGYLDAWRVHETALCDGQPADVAARAAQREPVTGDGFYAEHRRRLQAMGVTNIPERQAWTMNQIFYHWGHRWIYDREEIVHAAVGAGFSYEQVRPASFRRGTDELMAALDLPVRNDESLYVEIVKDGAPC